MRTSFRVFLILPSMLLILTFTGCATFRPVPLSDVPFMERAETKSNVPADKEFLLEFLVIYVPPMNDQGRQGHRWQRR
jgi:hypothetical protein